jgi:OOP family OmpA-OmpF porin
MTRVSLGRFFAPGLAIVVAAACGLATARDSAAAPGAQPGAVPVSPLVTRSLSLPAQGLFDGDRLTPAAQQRLGDLVQASAGMRVEVAFVMPVGPWRLDRGGADERDLTPARLAAVREFLATRGLDARHIFVESRLDDRVRAPRLDVQVMGRMVQD